MFGEETGSSMKKLKPNSKVYVAPASPAGRALARRLTESGHQLLGYADNLKKAEHVINDVASAKRYDFILVANGRFQKEIVEGLLDNGFDKKKLKVEGKEGDLKPYRYLPFSFALNRLPIYVWKILLVLASLKPRKLFVYYAGGFVDTNVLLTWAEHHRLYCDEALLIALDVNEEYAERIINLPGAIVNKKLRVFWCLARAKAVIIDHEYNSDWFSMLRNYRPVVQLWHGLPYKSLTGNSHFPNVEDVAFISSSRWFNDHVFKKIFSAKEFVDIGYSRCDALIQPRQERQWLGSVDHHSLTELIEKKGPIWVYMPTYRDDGKDEINLDFSKLDRLMKRLGRVLLVKFHPFLQEKLHLDGCDNSNFDVQLLTGVSQIYSYPSEMNIYTWLADSEGLITDYSSVAFDYSVLGRPIIYYQYDKKCYQKVRGEFSVPDEIYPSGVCVTNESDLMKALESAVANSNNNSIDSVDPHLKVEKSKAAPKIVEYIRTVV